MLNFLYKNQTSSIIDSSLNDTKEFIIHNSITLPLIESNTPRWTKYAKLHTYKKRQNVVVFSTLYHKISNFIELTDTDFELIDLLSNTEKINLLKQMNKCVKCLIGAIEHC